MTGASSFAVLGNSAYFQGFDAAAKPSLFKLDGAGAVSEIIPANVSPQGLSPSAPPPPGCRAIL